MQVLRKFLAGFVSLLLFSATAAMAQTVEPAAAEDLSVIRAMHDARDIRASAHLTGGAAERIYYVAKEGDGDVFCILIKNRGGEWAREMEAAVLLPGGMRETPFIAFDNDRRVYITYYPGDVVSTSLFLYGCTLVHEGGQWYVEAVSFGSLEAAEGIFKALVINLARKNTSEYAFNVKTEEIVSSSEFPNKIGLVRVNGFSLDDLKAASA